MHDRGISREGDLLDLAHRRQDHRQERLLVQLRRHAAGPGRENAKQYLRDNPALVEEITSKILEKRGLLGGVTGPASNGQPEPVEEEPAPTAKGKRQPAAAE